MENKKTKKKNKRGFTLTELIAVIVIIGILSTLVILGVNRYIEKARENTYNSYVKTMENAAENMMIECASGKNDCYDEIPNFGETNKIDFDEELVKKGYAEKLKDPEKNGSFCGGYVEVKNNSDSNGSVSKLSYKACLTCGGENKAGDCKEVEQTTYAFSSCEELNNSIHSGSRIIEGSWISGERVINFGCKNGGNCKYQKVFKPENTKIGTYDIEIENEVSCPINVYVDNQKPSCSVELAGATEMSGEWHLSAPTMKIDYSNNEGKTITSYGINTSVKTEYNMQTELTVSNGITTVFGYVKDSLGNEGKCNPREVKVDTGKPKQKVAMGYQVYAKDNSKSGNSLSIDNLSKYEGVRGIVIYLTDGVDAQVGIDYKKEGEETRSLTVEGNNKTEIENILDDSKLVDTIEIKNIDVTKIDKVYLIVNNTSLEVYTNKDMLVYSFASDQITGISEYRFKKGNNEQEEISSKPYIEINSNMTVEVRVKDISGFMSDAEEVEISRIDKEKPTIAVNFYKWNDNDTKPTIEDINANPNNYAGYNSGDWSDKKIMSVASGTDSGVSGIDYYQFTTTGKTTNETIRRNYRNIEANGQSGIKYVVCDKAGNCTESSVYSVLIDTGDINIKVTAYKRTDDGDPTGDPIKIGGYDFGTSYTTATYKKGTFTNKHIVTDWYNYNITFKLEIDSTSPIEKVEERISPSGYSTFGDSEAEMPSEWNQKSTDAIQYFGIAANGARVRQVKIKSRVGNSKTIKLLGKVDSSKPTVKVTAYKRDDDGNPTGSALEVTAYTSSSDETTVTGTVTNKHVRIEDWKNYKVTFHTVSTSISPIVDVKYELTPSGITSYTAANTDSSWANSTTDTRTCGSTSCTKNLGMTADGARVGKVIVTDEAGNSRTIMVRGKVDITKPFCNGVNSSNGNVSCGDAMSGCKKATYSYSSTVTIKDNAENTRNCTVSTGTCYNSWTVNSTRYCYNYGSCTGGSSYNDVSINNTTKERWENNSGATTDKPSNICSGSSTPNSGGYFQCKITKYTRTSYTCYH